MDAVISVQQGVVVGGFVRTRESRSLGEGRARDRCWGRASRRRTRASHGRSCVSVLAVVDTMWHEVAKTLLDLKALIKGRMWGEAAQRAVRRVAGRNSKREVHRTTVVGVQ